MTPFDLSVIFFFAIAGIKVCVDMYNYWREYDEMAAAYSELAVTPNPKHISAPVRKSPSNPSFKTQPTPMVGGIRKQPVAKTTRVAHPVHVNRNVRPACVKQNRPAAKRSKIVA